MAPRNRWVQVAHRNWSKLFKSREERRRLLGYESLEDRRLLAEITWLSTMPSGFWHDGRNWNLGREPMAGDDVRIGNQNVTYRRDISPALKSLETGGNLTVTGSTSQLIVSGPVTMTNSNATLTLTDRAEMTASRFDVNGSVNLEISSELRVTGTVRVGGTFSLRNSTLVDAEILATSSPLTVPVKGTLVNVTSHARIDLGASSVELTVQGRLTLNNTMTVGASSVVSFAGNQASLLGTGTVVFTNGNANGLDLLTNNMTLTIGPSMTIRGGNARNTTTRVGFGGASVAGTLRVEGKIIADAGMSIIINDRSSNSSPFTNTLQIANSGELRAEGGTLYVAGKFTHQDAARITQSSTGSIHLVGQLDNTGNNFAFSATTGSWNLSGGKVIGGTLTQSVNHRLNFTTAGGTLENVTLVGDSVIQGNIDIDILGSLTLQNTLTLGQGASLSFAGAAASLLGSGALVFDNKISNSLIARQANMTLTLGRTLTVRGGNSTSFRTSPSSVSRIYATASGVTLRVEGSITSDSGRSIAIGTMNFNSTSSPMRLINAGTLDAGQGALFLDGVFRTADLGTIKQSSGEINLVGALDNTGQQLSFSTTTGSWNLLGGSIINGVIRQTLANQLRFTTVGGTLTNVQIDGDTSMGTNTEFNVSGNLTLNGGTLTLGNRSGVLFVGSGSSPDASLLGNGRVFFESGGNNALVAWRAGMTLTIGKDITIRGGQATGSVSSVIGYADSFINGSSVGQNTTIRVEGKVIADLPGRRIEVQPKNRLINTSTGLLEASSGILALGGTYTREELGLVKNSGGSIQIVGTLENQNKTLGFDAVSGSWSLVGGTIIGGTVQQGANSLLFSSEGGTLDGVVLQGDANLVSDRTRVNVVRGLTLNGTATLGADSRLTFSGTQSLTGQARIVFQNKAGNAINANGKDMVLTIGPDVVISGGGGAAGVTSAIADATVGINNNVTVILNGTILADNPLPTGAIRINLPNGRFINNGKVESRGGEIRFSQNMTLPTGGTLISNSGGLTTFAGDVSFEGNDPSKIRLIGTNSFTGSNQVAAPQLLEALSKDVGATQAGFSDSNFVLGTIVVRGNTKLRLIDLVDNAPNDTTGPNREAVYVNSLIIEADAELNIGELNLYYRSISLRGSGSRIGRITASTGMARPVDGGGVLPFNTPIPGALDSQAQRQHVWTFQGTQGGWVTLDVNPATGAAINLNWARVRLFDANDNLLRTAVSTSSGAAATITNFVLPRNGVYRVVVDAAPSNPNSVGTYIITALDTTPDRRRVNLIVTSSQLQGVEYGGNIEFTAFASAQAPTAPRLTGSVQFRVDGADSGAPVPLVDGVARLALTRPSAGARNVTAVYLSDNGNFDTISTSFIQQIKKVVLTVRANDVQERIAGSPVNLSFSASGFVTGEGVGLLRGTPALTIDSAAVSAVGRYIINVAQGTLDADNYSFQFVTGIMVVKAAAPARISLVSGGNQSVIFGRALPVALRLRVFDAFNNPIPNAAVDFSSPTSGPGGTFASGLTTFNTVTSNLGEAQTSTFTVNSTPGSFLITAVCGTVETAFTVTVVEAGAPLEFIAISGEVLEGAGKVAFRLQRNTTITSPLTVNLASSHPELAQVPASITFPINVDIQEFEVTVIDDAVASGLIGSGPKQVVLSAIAGTTTASLQLLVSDNDTAALALQFNSTAQEGNKLTGTVTRNTPLASELVVRLNSDSFETISIPTTVTIASGQSSATFDIQTNSDFVAFGSRTANITAEVPGMLTAERALSVIDVDLPAITIEAINSSDVSEREGSTTFRVRRNTRPSSPLDVEVRSSIPGAVRLPAATIVIPQGAASVDFVVSAVNDSVVSDNRDAVITVTSGPLSANHPFTVREDDVPTLNFTLESNQLAEGGGGFLVLLSRNTALLPALTVDLDASNPGQLKFPSRVTFQPDATSLLFSLSALDDNAFDGSQAVLLSARSPGFIEASASLQIEDNETLSISASDAIISEKGGQTSLTVTRNVDNLDQPLTVNLISTDVGELPVPLNITIPAGRASTTVVVTAVDDQLLDGLQSLVVIASADGYVSAQTSVEVSDEESLSVQFEVAAIAEAASRVMVTISRSTVDDLSSELTVQLFNSHPSRISFAQNTIVLPVGIGSATIEGTLQDNSEFVGDVRVSLTATAQNFTAAEGQLTIIEDDLVALTSAASTLSEKGGKVMLRIVRFGTSLEQPLVVSLQSTDITELTVPQIVVIPANEREISFEALAVDDQILDGPQQIQIIASASGSADSKVPLTVSDFESLVVSFNSTSISEAGGRVLATITRSNIEDLANDVTVTLQNPFPSRIDFGTGTIVIPANTLAVTVEGRALENTIVDSNSQISITATADGFTSEPGTLTIIDNDTWTNPRNRFDVNDDGQVTPLDVVLTIAALRSGGARPLVTPRTGLFFDTSRDSNLSPLDVVLIIGDLNSRRGSGEGESATDAVFANYDLEEELPGRQTSKRSQPISGRVRQRLT